MADNILSLFSQDPVVTLFPLNSGNFAHQLWALVLTSSTELQSIAFRK